MVAERVTERQLSQQLTQWQQAKVSHRLRVIRGARHWLAENTCLITSAIDRAPAETLVTEVLPLLEACKFLERSANQILATKLLGRTGQPFWLKGVDVQLRREPIGTVLVIGPQNYPFMLPGIQVMQALVAGNAVLLKPGANGRRSAVVLEQALISAGLPSTLLTVLGEAPEDAQRAIEEGVDKVIFTGSFANGRTVAASLASKVTPSVMELSGDDPVFILQDADPNLVMQALRFGIQLNSGNTCIAPRRIYLNRLIAPQLEERLRMETPSLPVTIVSTDEEALALAAESPYALGATVFGSRIRANVLARQIRAGVVVVNDMIVPTADPRIPFGGRGKSGFGVTRGEAGLLEMTVTKAIAVRRNRWLPHLRASQPTDEQLFTGMIAGSHGRSIGIRFAGWKKAALAAMAREKGAGGK